MNTAAPINVACCVCTIRLETLCNRRAWWFRAFREVLATGVRLFACIYRIRPTNYKTRSPFCHGCLRFKKNALKEQSALFRRLDARINPVFNLVRDSLLTEQELEEARRFAADAATAPPTTGRMAGDDGTVVAEVLPAASTTFSPAQAMLLREHFEHTGQWLFRWRSYLPVLLVGLLPLALWRYEHPFGSPHLDVAWEFFCFAVSTFGLLLRVKTVGHAPKGTSGRNMRHQRADTLNTTGMYSVVRNPLYVGNFFMYLGVALVPRFWWMPLLLLLAFILYYERIVYAEEQFLERQFGQQYLDWASVTPAFLPRWRNWKPAALPFSLKTVIKREYLGFCGMTAMFVIVELAENAIVYRKPRLDWPWQILAVVGITTFVIIRVLRKRTTRLDAPNR